MKRRISSALLLWLAAGAPAALAAPAAIPAGPPPLDPREVHLSDLVQLTFEGENAEAYWSPDGKELVMQSTHPPYACDQIFRRAADGKGTWTLVSTGKGKTTCSYFTKNGDRILFSSTHAAGDACPPPPDRSHGYVWSIDPNYEIYSAKPDGSDLKRLTDNGAYDAESTVCPVDGSVVFTSTRDGDLDLYRMDADGSHVRRLTDAPGYDGGAFFSPDCSHIVWRASRPEGKELEDYRALLAKGLVRPTQLEIFVAKADGTDVHQATHLGAASFAPSFFPSGQRILFSSNYGDPKGREFDIWAVDVDGGNLERITWMPGFDGFPLFSPDGTRVAFSSNRRGSAPGETDVFVARWVAHPAEQAAAVRFHDDVAWLADDAREGRGIGSAGLAAARDWLADRFREIGLAPGGDNGGYLHAFDVPVAIEVGEATAVAVDGRPLARGDFQPAAFSGVSAGAPMAAPVVAAGYGITAPELEIDDYKGVDVKGKIALVRRFTPAGAPFDKDAVERRYSDVRLKAWNAREHGAVGLIVVDQPAGASPASMGSTDPPAEASLPEPKVDVSVAATAAGDAGLPVLYLKRAAGAALFTGAHDASLAVALTHRTSPAANVVGIVRAGAAERLPGAVLVGAHYDHIGHGGAASLAPDSHDIHHGADDNASGTAALLAVGRRLAARRGELRRDVWLVAFSGEEEGALGSSAFVRRPPAGLALADLTAMLNMDMVGRLRNDALSVLGSETAPEWNELVPPLCRQHHLTCTLGGDGFGASDQTSFYAAGAPVIHFFTGIHEDYHKPSDDAAKINAEGGARVASLMADVAAAVADRPGRLTYKSVPAPPPTGDVRSAGAGLGTVPDYAGDGRPGVLLAGVRAGSAAEKGGLQRGDLLVELAGTPIRDIHDLMFVLRRAKPGEKSLAVVDRGGTRVSLAVTFEASRR